MKWWLISNKDVTVALEYLREQSRLDERGEGPFPTPAQRALYALESGLHTTDAVPDDFKPLEATSAFPPRLVRSPRDRAALILLQNDFTLEEVGRVLSQVDPPVQWPEVFPMGQIGLQPNIAPAAGDPCSNCERNGGVCMNAFCPKRIQVRYDTQP